MPGPQAADRDEAAGRKHGETWASTCAGLKPSAHNLKHPAGTELGGRQACSVRRTCRGWPGAEAPGHHTQLRFLTTHCTVSTSRAGTPDSRLVKIARASGVPVMTNVYVPSPAIEPVTLSQISSPGPAGGR